MNTPTRRLLAWAVDWLLISAYAAALVPLGLLWLRSYGRFDPLVGDAVSVLVLVLPVTVWLAAWERGRRAATPGKRLLGVRVLALDGEAPGWRRALVRNALKITLPWVLGHTAAFVLSAPGAGGVAALLGLASGIAACLVAVGYLVALFLGRMPYDRVAGTEVVAAAR